MDSSFYITCCSDSSAQYFPDNRIAHFSVQLPQQILLTEDSHFEVAVCEVFIPVCNSCPMPDSLSPVYLYSDIVKPQILSDTNVRLLRVLPPPLTTGHFIFSNLYYLPVGKRVIDSISFSFATKTGARYPFPDASFQPSIAVLHFRKRL
jgi:hypothetical protein